MHRLRHGLDALRIEFDPAGLPEMHARLIAENALDTEEIAIVYVPTTPNPTSGYLEMVPVKNLVATNMTLEDAITMIVSGGAITPKDFSLSPGAKGPTAVKNPTSPDATTPIADPADASETS